MPHQRYSRDSGTYYGGESVKMKTWSSNYLSTLNHYQNNNYKSGKKLSVDGENGHVDFKEFPTIHPEPLTRPFHGLGCSCMPNSSKSLVTFTTSKLGLRNLLNVPFNSGSYSLTRWSAYVVYCVKLKVPNKYPILTNKAILSDRRIQDAIEKSVTEELMNKEADELVIGKRYVSLMASWQVKASAMLDNMKAALSSVLIRVVGYTLFKVFSRLFMSVMVNEGQLEMIEKAAERNIPMVFVPLHRSHVDYLFVTWVLFNRQISAPIVAAGDNLRMALFGSLLRGLGGFFIKRRLDKDKNRKDHVYRAVLQCYLSRALQAGYNIEFFIEGGRTRTGKHCMPKGGLLSVIVDEFLEGRVDDVLFVPIAINYDKILDGNFIREQLGHSKVPESFWRAVRAICKVLSTNYGHSRIDFSQPFSLREFFQSSKSSLKESLLSSNISCVDTQSQKMTNGHCRSLSNPLNPDSQSLKSDSDSPPALFLPSLSNSSLRTEVSEEYKCFVTNLASHIVYDAEKIQAIMASNVIAWLLSYVFREGTSLQVLAEALDELIEDLRSRGRDTGFSGHSVSVVIHGIQMLGSHLVEVEGSLEPEDPTLVFVRPKIDLPNVIELNYYANALNAIYAMDAVVGTCLLTMVDQDLWSYVDVVTDFSIRESNLADRCRELCKLLRHEFVFVPPCGDLDDKIHDSIHRLVVNGLFREVELKASRTHYMDDADSDEEWEQDFILYYLTPNVKNLKLVSCASRTIAPVIEAYYATGLKLDSLLAAPRDSAEFVGSVQTSVRMMLTKGSLHYNEAVAADLIRNALKSFESDGVLDSYVQDSLKVLFLTKEFESERSLCFFQNSIASFRV